MQIPAKWVRAQVLPPRSLNGTAEQFRKQGSDQIVAAEGLLHERCDFVDGNRRDCVTGDDDDRDASLIEVIDETESHLLLQVQVDQEPALGP